MGAGIFMSAKFEDGEVLILVCVEVSVGARRQAGTRHNIEVLILVCVEVSVGGY